MSTPFLFIFFPLIFCILSMSQPRGRDILASIALVICLLLSLIAWYLPVGENFFFGPWTGLMVQDMQVFGFRMLIGDSMRGYLTLVFGSGFIWLFFALVVLRNHNFVLLGLAFLSGLVAVHAVDTIFLSAALTFFAVLSGVILLAPHLHGEPAGNGALRFLIFNSLAIPLLVLAGGYISGLGTVPAGLEVVFRPTVLLALGFAFLLAIFPFYAWIPVLFEKNRPFQAAFVALFFHISMSILGLQIVDRFVWLRDSQELYAVLRFTGLMVMGFGGVFSLFQRHWGRQLGFALIFENGVLLTAVGSGRPEGIAVIPALFLARTLGFVVWAGGLAIVKEHTGSLWFHDLEGAGRKLPWIVSMTILGQLSIGGAPLLAGFAPKVALVLAIIPQAEAVGMWIAMLGVLAGGLRVLSVLMLRPGETENTGDGNAEGDEMLGRIQRIFLSLGIILLFLAGFFPHWPLEFMLRFTQLFSFISR